MSSKLILDSDLEQMNTLGKQIEFCDEFHKDGCLDDDDLSSELIGERLRGDGQEEKEAHHHVVHQKKIDDDEDRRNPQYIPKRGNFYEHDDRTLENDDDDDAENDGDTNEDEDNQTNDSNNVLKISETGDTRKGKGDTEKETPIRNKKKVWEEKGAGERWGHDLYIEEEQLPKTKHELVNAYGYDIRNEDGPPRARRRRRYGRGPNKYTRNWEDEDAYSRSQHNNVRTNKNQKNTPPTKEDFPALNAPKQCHQSIEEPHQEPTQFIQPVVPHDNRGNNDFNDQQPHKKERTPRPRKVVSEKKDDYAPKPSRKKSMESKKYDPIPSQSYSNSNRIKNMATMTEHGVAGGSGDCCQLSRDMTSLKIDGKVQQVMPDQGCVVPQQIVHQNVQRVGPKRYSSLRQRSLPETQGTTGQQYQSGYYPGSNPDSEHQQIQMQQIPSQIINHSGPPPNVGPQQQLIQHPSLLAPAQVSHHHPIITAASHPPPLLTQHIQNHPQYVAAPPQAYQVPPPGVTTSYNLQQGGTPAYIAAAPPQPSAVMNSVYTPPVAQQPPPQYAAAPPYSSYQPAYTAPPAQPPQDLYQTPGGITYYSPHSQTAAGRAPPLKRPKAAIPILAPPERQQPRGRGRCSPTELNAAVVNNEDFINRGRGRKMSADIVSYPEIPVEYADSRCVENAVHDNSEGGCSLDVVPVENQKVE